MAGAVSQSNGVVPLMRLIDAERSAEHVLPMNTRVTITGTSVAAAVLELAGVTVPIIEPWQNAATPAQAVLRSLHESSGAPV